MKNGPRIQDYAVLSSSIHKMLDFRPDIFMYHPLRPMWGWYRIGLSDTVALHLPDIITIMCSFTGNLEKLLTIDMEIDLHTLARSMHGDFKIKQMARGPLSCVTIGNQEYRGCVLTDASVFQWMNQIATTVPDIEPIICRIPVPVSLSPEVYGVGPLDDPLIKAAHFPSKEHFLQIVSHPDEYDIFPEPLKSIKIIRWQIKNTAIERCRLISLRRSIPAWVDELEADLLKKIKEMT